MTNSICRSAVAVEALALSAGFDAAHVIRTELQTLLKQDVPLAMLTDSNQCFEAIANSTSTKERRVQLNLSAIKEGYEKTVILNLHFIRSEYNLADSPHPEMDNTGLLIPTSSR